MEQIFTVPEGFEIKKISDNQFSIVEKKEKVDNSAIVRGDIDEIKSRQMHDVVTRHENNFFKQIDNRDDYDYDSIHYDKELRESLDRDALFDDRIGNPYNQQGEFDYGLYRRQQNIYHDMYRSGKIQKINTQERRLLEFCDGIDVKGFLKEEFKNNPINIGRDDNGNLTVDVPNGVENLGNTDPSKFKRDFNEKPNKDKLFD